MQDLSESTSEILGKLSSGTYQIVLDENTFQPYIMSTDTTHMIPEEVEYWIEYIYLYKSNRSVWSIRYARSE